MTHLSKILIPIDFSENCAIAVRQAGALARRFHSGITMLHVNEFSVLHPLSRGERLTRAAIWILALSSLVRGAPQSRDLILSGRLEDLNWPDFSDFRTDIDGFYVPTAYAPAWSRDGAITPQAMAVIEALKGAESKGLNPEDYDASRWAARLAHLDLVRFDLALTVSVMRYVSDLHAGKWNPAIYHSEADLRLGDLIRRLADAPNVAAVLFEIEPPFPGYRRTAAALQNYLALARADDGALLPPPPKFPIEPGASYPGVPRLAALLRRLGDLPGDCSVPETYHRPLVDAVRHFQLRHGLDADGRIGKSTFAELNTPLSQRVRQLHA